MTPMRMYLQRDVFKVFLAEHNYSQKDFALKLKMKPPQLSDLVRGRHAAGPAMRQRITAGLLQVFGKTPKKLFDFQK